MLPGKVAALITRNVGGVIELCVFDHAGFVQLPAGTMEVGERPEVAAAREAWEETGLPNLEVVGKVATMPQFDDSDPADLAMLVAPVEGCPIPIGHDVVVHERVGSTATVTCHAFEWTGAVPGECVRRDVTRHVFHLRTTTSSPEEWFVRTPDGGGNEWRCRWVPLDEARGLPVRQQRWLDAGRPSIDPGPPVERSPASEALPVFDAYEGAWR